MRNRYVLVTAVAFLAASLIASIVRSQEKPATGDKKAPTPEEMMQAWQKYGTPGKEHEIFKSIEGTFNADVTMQMPGAPSPEKSSGVANNKLIFEGRYLH